MIRTMSNLKGGRWLAAPVALALLAPFLGCENPLRVREPEFLTPEGTSLELLVAGAIGDFQFGYSGGGLTDRFLSTSALLTDEFGQSDTFAEREATDRRQQRPLEVGNTSDLGYLQLQRARRAAIRAAGAVADEAGPNDPRVAQMKVLEGLSIVALAEGFCSNIPLSEVTPGGELIPGPPLTTQQLFETAVAAFDEALAIQAGNNAAAVGKGRALLSLGRFQEAAAAVAGVPTSFIFAIEHSASTSRQENPIFNLQSNGRYSLSDVEGINGLPFRSAQDPRVPWEEDPLGGFDDTIRLFLTLKHAFGRSQPVIVVDGVLARLIEAEAALDAGNTAGWLAIHNALRADVANLMAARIPNYGAMVPGPNNPTTTLPPLTDPGSPAARVDLHFAEKAFWLHLNGHRLGDLRRMVRQYGRAQNTVYPTGEFFRGGTFGNDVALPLSFEEVNNPNWSVGLCDPTQA